MFSFFKETDFSTTPTPPCSNEGLQPLPQTPFPLQGRDLDQVPNYSALYTKVKSTIKSRFWSFISSALIPLPRLCMNQ